MLLFFKNNYKYIINVGYKCVTIVFSFISFFALLIPINTILNCINNVCLRIIVAILVLASIYLIIIFFVTWHLKKYRQVKLFDLHSNHSLYVEYGDIFLKNNTNEIKNIVFAGNRCFDTIVDDDLIGLKKIHGIALKRIYQYTSRDENAVSIEIQNNLDKHKYHYDVLDRSEKRKGNLKRYEVGAIAEIDGLNNERYFILGLTYFDNELRARVDKSDYIKAISSLMKFISDRSQGYSTYMPIIGTGGSDVDNTKELLAFLVKTIEMFKNIIDCDIHIVINEIEVSIGLLNLKNI